MILVVILENLILTGLRGVGKTVLLETFNPIATNSGWVWAGDDLSEAASLTEERIVTRLFTDIATVTSSWVIGEHIKPAFGFEKDQTIQQYLTYDFLIA